MHPEGLMNARRPNPKRRRRFALPAHSKSFALYVIVGLVLLYGIIYPTTHVFIAALQRDGGWSPANFFAVLSQRAVLESAATSRSRSFFSVANQEFWRGRFSTLFI
jgi:hypothetical protein